MAEGPSNEQINRLRWLTIIAVVVLFTADYGFDILAKEVPDQVYFVLAAIALGIDLGTLRKIAVSFLKTWAGVSDDRNVEERRNDD